MHFVVTPPVPVVKEDVRELPGVPSPSDHRGATAHWRFRREPTGTCRVERGWPILGPAVAVLTVVILLDCRAVYLL